MLTRLARVSTPPTLLNAPKQRLGLWAQTVKNLPAMLETRVLSLGQEYPLEKEMATPSSIFAWRIPWTEEPGGLSSMVTKIFVSLYKKCLISVSGTVNCTTTMEKSLKALQKIKNKTTT